MAKAIANGSATRPTGHPAIRSRQTAVPCSYANTRLSEESTASKESWGRLQRLFHFVQHPQSLLEMGVEVSAHEIQDLNDDGITNRVEHLVASLASRDKLLRSQDRKVPRVRLLKCF